MTGRDSGATAISADGNVVVGNAVDVQGKSEAFRWAGGTMTLLGKLPDPTGVCSTYYCSYARGTNADGSVVVGYGLVNEGTPDPAGRAFVWTGGTMSQIVPPCSPRAGRDTTSAAATSANGSVVVGDFSCDWGAGQAFRSVGGTTTGLGIMQGYGSSTATSVSADGSVVVGYSSNINNTAAAFRWQSGSMTSLGFLPGRNWMMAHAISGDGSTIYGIDAGSPATGFRWTSGTLFSIAGGNASPPKTSSYNGLATADSSQRWTARTGWKYVASLLTANGVDLTGWTISGQIYLASDGKTFAGTVVDPNGKNQAYIARLPLYGSSHDFNLDGDSEILWRANAGDIAMWFMSGTTLQSGSGVGAIDPNWQIVKTPTGTADFDGDSKSDILWHHTNGSVALWFMNGATIASASSLGAIDPSWQIAGIGDFDGDGKSDILWRNANGALSIWFMNGATISSSGAVGSIVSSWQVAAIADLNGDGRADIVLRNTSTGDVAVWLMNGATIASGAGLGVLPSAWQIVGTADFDGDGKADILWRHSSGAMAMWFMNGTAIASSAGLGAVDPSWSVASTGDYDGNGKADLVWHSTSGDVAVWLMNGASITSSASLGVLPSVWSIVE